MSAVGPRRRRRTATEVVEEEDSGERQRKRGDPVGGPRVLWPEPRTVLCLLCVAACGLLVGLVFQQSTSFADVLKRLQLLQLKDSELNALKERLHFVSEKLGTSEDHVEEIIVSAALVARLEQQVSRVRNTIHGFQTSQEKILQQLQNLQEKLHNAADTCRLHQDEVYLSLVNLKSEVKSIHSHITSEINTAEQGVKLLTERVKELDDGTRRNIQTIRRQEEGELFHVKKQLEQGSKITEKLEAEQSTLFARDTDLNQQLSEYKPKLSECKNHLAAVERAVLSILRVSNELLSMTKRTDGITIQTFNTEKSMLKVVGEIKNMQQALERV
ncbi:inhibitor of nuclear factor kappa-B kinase-interacting protein isoform X2 [Microcaecilia unicolor]|uniref:Inhibitor of nuclear factor kappa-B kinase-interacting protein isoform X2 n=1 Tax=Microcaecilia unicolor TaxID=1415580 RepID=A0A6P7Z6N4_9AMPH|nr:inhibitor of nuclear factor kappa-B kinase-interacting protein isoform X2 [Microcaecilia unicolor]